MDWLNISVGIAFASILKGVLVGIIQFFNPKLYEESYNKSIEAKLDKLIKLKEEELKR